MAWFYQKMNNVSVRGLSEHKAISRMLKRKQLMSDDLVWVVSGNMGYWRPLRSVEVFHAKTGRLMTWVLFACFLVTFLFVLLFNQNQIVAMWSYLLKMFS